MNKVFFTISQIAKDEGESFDKVRKILRDVTPDGSVSRWPGYKLETYKTAREEYYKNHTNNLINEEEPESTGDKTLDLQLQEARLRKDLAAAEALELNNAERKKILINRKDVEDFIQFYSTVIVTKIKELTRDIGEEFYNDTVTEITSELTTYLEDNELTSDIREESLHMELVSVTEDYDDWQDGEGI